jgi:hypothetical protein
MRVETVRAWMLAGFCLLTLGTLLYTFQFIGRVALFVMAMGFVYFIIGAVLGHIHNHHMIKRTRAGRE